eukprot:TRINITY_DN656_c0_g1_i2.p2 TRINITY_DN656_c0_g1~~TRINITY_DN656_c0_g1_i2.p2  ORF type:complete len:57 (-),score=4.58 TRINITY_DN656_c0_g1_i2:25-195(-)
MVIATRDKPKNVLTIKRGLVARLKEPSSRCQTLEPKNDFLANTMNPNNEAFTWIGF